MNHKLLIDAFVRQTMVLIAQVATMAGVRTPLAHVANQVFLDLTHALEQQGLGRKVVADMFGLALRSYQQKVDRLTESASAGGVTLWEAIHRYLMERGAVARSDLLRHFSHDDPNTVAGILRDLIETGLVYRTGRGDAAVYRAAPVEDLRQVLGSDGHEAAAAFAWATIYRQGPLTRAALLEALPLDDAAIDRALEALLQEGRVERIGDGEQAEYSSQRMLLSLGENAGWEASLLDHYHAVLGGICAKLRNGQTRALPGDQLGGSTFSFDVWPGHPHESKVISLLAEHRRTLAALWDQVSTHNQRGKPASFTKVTFYFGQLLTREGSEQDETED
jgi:predicted transcriptional regulator